MFDGLKQGRTAATCDGKALRRASQTSKVVSGQSRDRWALCPAGPHEKGALVLQTQGASMMDDDELMASISSGLGQASCLFVVRGWRMGISVSCPQNGSKKSCDERFRAVCVFLSVASQKRVYVSKRKLMIFFKDKDFSAHDPLFFDGGNT